MELVTVVPAQKKRGMLEPDQQANLVRKAAQPPDRKKQDISDWMTKHKRTRDKVAKDFRLSIESSPLPATGRILPSPIIEYKTPQHYYAGTTGAWNMKDVRLSLCPAC
jgi:hypothetical protein